MARYRISGIWKDTNNVITHYAFHEVLETSITRAEKTSKAEAIACVEKQGNIVYTWVWNYKRAFWDVGEKVEVVNGNTGKYLRTTPDNTLTDNLGHLIDFDWIKLY